MAVLDESILINRYFEEIAQIPHGSYHEEGIADYICLLYTSPSPRDS